MGKPYTFDYFFYKNFYPDIKSTINNDTESILLEHYKTHGIKEKRVCCQKELDDIIAKNTNRIKKQKKELKNRKFKKTEKKLNILIRTSNRPRLFKKCIESVLKQKYSNFHIYVCYDNMDSHNYVKYYEALYNNITVFFVKNDSTNKYKFNLYNNELMSKVTDGFILFLDDDDVYTHNLCFKLINNKIIDDNSILLWKFMRPDKLVYPKTVDNIQLGEIDTTIVCFHNKHKNLAKWQDRQCGDFYFYTDLFKKKEINNTNIIKVNYIITKTSYDNKSCNSS